MAANTAPIFPLTPNIGGIGNAALLTANTAADGTGTVSTVFTAGTNGSWVQKVRFRAAAGGNNIQTVARVFLNNGSTNATATNNIQLSEITLPATTSSSNSAITDIDLVLNIPIPAGYKINVVIGTTVATGYYITGWGGDY